MNIKKFIKLDTHDNFVTEKADVIQNKLLGDYNAKGKYVINKKIVTELVELKKVKVESYNNSIFVNAKTQFGRNIDFQIDFKKNSNSHLATGVLSTLEPVEKQGGRLTNIIKTPIAKYTNELVPDFVDRTLKAFNVVVNAEGDVKERKEENVDAYLLKRNMLLKALDKLTVESYNTIYEDYFTQRINLLKKINNSYSKKILAIFNEEFSKISEHFLMDKKSKKVTNYKAMNELLDKAFEDLAGMENYEEQEKQYREKILPILLMFINSAERLEKTSHSQVLDTFPRKAKEALTDTLVDIKQTQTSAIPHEVQEQNPQALQDKMNKKIESIDEKLNKEQTQQKTVSQPSTSVAEFVAQIKASREKPAPAPSPAVDETTDNPKRDSATYNLDDGNNLVRKTEPQKVVPLVEMDSGQSLESVVEDIKNIDKEKTSVEMASEQNPKTNPCFRMMELDQNQSQNLEKIASQAQIKIPPRGGEVGLGLSKQGIGGIGMEKKI